MFTILNMIYVLSVCVYNLYIYYMPYRKYITFYFNHNISEQLELFKCYRFFKIHSNLNVNFDLNVLNGDLLSTLSNTDNLCLEFSTPESGEQ